MADEKSEPTINELLSYANSRAWKGAFDLTLGPLASAYDLGKETLGFPSDVRGSMERDLASRGHYPQGPAPGGTGGEVAGMIGEFLGGSALPNAILGRVAFKIAPQLIRRGVLRTMAEPMAAAPGRFAAAEFVGSVAGGTGAGLARATYPGNAYVEVAAGLLTGISGVAAVSARRLPKAPPKPEPPPSLPPKPREPGVPPHQKTTVDIEPPSVALPGEDVTLWQAAKIEEAMGGAAEIKKYAANLNLERRESPAEIKRALQELTDQHGGDQAFWARRRGYQGEEGPGRAAGDRTATVSQEEVLANSEKYVGEMLGKTPEEIADMRISGDWLTERLAAADTALHVTDYEVALARQAMREGAENGQEEWLRALTRQAAVAYELSGSSSEVARALNILKRGTTTRKKAIARAHILKRFGGEGDVEELAKRLDALDDDAMRAGVGRAMVRNADRGWGWTVADIWKAGLLSGPSTHMVNIKSNALFTAWFHGFEQPASAVIGLAKAPFRAALGKERDRVFLQEAGAEIYGLLKAIPLAARTSLRSTIDDVEWSPALHAKQYKKDMLGEGTGAPKRDRMQDARDLGYDVSAARRLGDKFSQFDVTPTKWKNRFTRIYPGGPFAMLRGEDAYFKHLAYVAHLHGLGMRDAIEKGLPIAERFAHVGKFVRNAPAKAMKESMDRAAELTYTNELGKVGKGIQQLANSHPLAAAFLTFVKTPANVMKQGARRTPGVGLIAPQNLKDLAAGGQRSDRALARIATGGALGLYYLNEIQDGRITGPMPDDAAERDLFMSEGKMPYSWLVERDGKEFWESYGRLEPLATPVAFLATMMNWNKQGLLSADDLEKVPALVGMALSENFMAKSMLQGPHKAARAAGEPSKFMEQYVEGLVGSVVPAGMTQLARAQDMFRRDQSGLWDSAAGISPAIAARVVGWREGLPVRYDLIGRPFPAGDQRDSTVKRLLSEYLSESRRDPILDAIGTTNARIRLASPMISIPKDQLYGEGPDQKALAEDGQMLDRPLTFEMRPIEQEYLNQVANKRAAEQLRKYIPKLMKFRAQHRAIDVSELKRLDVPETYIDGLKEDGMARAAVTDVSRDLIQQAYVFWRNEAKRKLVDSWRKNGTLREKVDEALKRQQRMQRGRER